MRAFQVASKDSYSPFRRDNPPSVSQSELELSRLDRLINEYRQENMTCSLQINDL